MPSSTVRLKVTGPEDLIDDVLLRLLRIKAWLQGIQIDLNDEDLVALEQILAALRGAK